MNKLAQTIAAGVLSAGFATEADAKPFNLADINPNALVDVMLRKVDVASGKESRALPYTGGDDMSLLCLGDVNIKGVMFYDEKGKPALLDDMTPETPHFAFDPDAKDKVSQERIRPIIESRKDLAYIEFATTGAPTGKQIGAYFTDVWQSAPIDVFQHGTAMRDGSKRTTLLMDQATIEKFAGANAAEIQALSDKYAADKIHPALGYSACGPKKDF